MTLSSNLENSISSETYSGVQLGSMKVQTHSSSEPLMGYNHDHNLKFQILQDLLNGSF